MQREGSARGSRIDLESKKSFAVDRLITEMASRKWHQLVVYAADFIKRPFIGGRKNLGEFRTRGEKLQARAGAQRVEKLIFMSPLRLFFLADAAKRKSNLSSESAKREGA